MSGAMTLIDRLAHELCLWDYGLNEDDRRDPWKYTVRRENYRSEACKIVRMVRESKNE
jgi:hypothetical protein